jgi:Xaa-Pro dipeptidase
MQENQIDQIILSDLTSIKYLTGCVIPLTQFLLALVINQVGKPTLITFVTNLGKVTDEVVHARYLQHQDSVEFLANYLSKDAKIAIDKKFSLGYFERLKNFVSFHYVVDSMVDSVRQIKDGEEQRRLRHASMIADQVMREVKEKLVIGISENDIRDYIKRRVVELGAEGLSFDPTIAFGVNTGVYRGPNRQLEDGDCVMLDFGCKYEGYCSDTTRFYTFKSNMEAQKMYQVVLAAQEAAYQIIKPGVKIKEAALAARKVIVDHGYGNNSYYHLGHGVGLGIHELFYVSVTNEEVFQEGMCFSVEPGIYIPRQIGCRVEDLVLVTKDGCEILNKTDKKMILLDE